LSGKIFSGGVCVGQYVRLA